MSTSKQTLDLDSDHELVPRGAFPVYGGDSGSLLLYSDINEVFADIKTVTGCDAIRIASEAAS